MKSETRPPRGRKALSSGGFVVLIRSFSAPAAIRRVGNRFPPGIAVSFRNSAPARKIFPLRYHRLKSLLNQSGLFRAVVQKLRRRARQQLRRAHAAHFLVVRREGRAVRHTRQLRNAGSGYLHRCDRRRHAFHAGGLPFNSTRIVRRNPTDSFDPTLTEIEAREQVFRLWQFLRDNIKSTNKFQKAGTTLPLFSSNK